MYEETIIYETRRTPPDISLKAYSSLVRKFEQGMPILWYTGVAYCFIKMGHCTIVGGVAVQKRKDKFSKKAVREKARGCARRTHDLLIYGYERPASTEERGLVLLELHIYNNHVTQATPNDKRVHSPYTVDVYVSKEDEALWTELLQRKVN